MGNNVVKKQAASTSSTLLTGKTGSYKTLVPFDQTAWHNTPTNHNLGMCVCIVTA
jgi:hypothetical protein